MNGWTTTRRFAQPLQKCHVCGGGSDSLEHYLQCPFTIGVWLQRFGQISQQVGIDDVLMLAHGNDGLHNSHIIARCVFLDCLHCAFQVQKSHSSFSMSTVEFARLCTAREQALGERKASILRALTYAKTGFWPPEKTAPRNQTGRVH